MVHMPITRRAPVLLYFVFGYTVAEVSDVMDVSTTTTKNRLKTALRELRTIFDRNPSLREAMLEVIR
jgi:DNA-directed RNA polymerase specialized sigma24 family protein